MGCKDSNLDNQIQNLESCHWTTSQGGQKVKNLAEPGQRGIHARPAPVLLRSITRVDRMSCGIGVRKRWRMKEVHLRNGKYPINVKAFRKFTE